ncbi:MAG TPA: 2-oxo acid dehydrogenase subunit E2 [Gemmataceae bacterium]|jgi:pyruvate dehydrogenase E2 component (dihydrolipoamide acetyltransferase)|nr:2-oxo acid dehydrogenase subunit E2 [Gemmataceae bacterium]
MELRLPELGEGITDATVVNVPVKPGQPVKAGDTVIEVETDKASMPIPATGDGTVNEVRVKQGDKIKVGAVIAVIGGAAPAARGEATKAAPPAPAPAAKPQAANHVAPARREFTLPNLGEGIENGIVVAVNVKPGDTVAAGQELFTIETDKASMPLPADADGMVEELRVKQGDRVNIGAVLAVLSGGNGSAAKPQAAPAIVKSQPAPVPSGNGSAGVINDKGIVPAGPATRRYAREHGVALVEVPGTARGGRITVDDVKTHIRGRMSTPVAHAPGSPGGAPPLPDFSKYGPIEKKPLSNIRKKIAENLTIAWHTAPAVTQFDLADITDLEAGRKRITEGLPKGSPKVTMTVLAIKAVVAALREFPNFAASLDMANGEVVFKQYFHVGIAVDTERGLVVPVIRDAEKKSIRDLALEVATLAEKARTGKLAIDEMRGGTFTITNLGGIGGTAFSPIINYPEVAILGMSRSSIQPVFKDGQFVPRLMMPLCLTYDHRIIDGADGARFTTRLVQLFSDPIRLLMES